MAKAPKQKIFVIDLSPLLTMTLDPRCSPLAEIGYTSSNWGTSQTGGAIIGTKLMRGPATLVGGMWGPGLG